MARLIIKSSGFNNQVVELRLGVNRFGRSKENDFQIEHATISGRHCEIVLGPEQVLVRDCGSTNGTYLNAQPVREALLQAGQTLCLGDVEFLVETTEVVIAIPKLEAPRPAPPPVVLSDGGLICPRHPTARATYQCVHCREVLCDACVTRLRRRGGHALLLCPLCSHRVEAIGGEKKKKKKSLMEFLHKTVKLPLLRGPKNPDV